jgi:hypothetical protein
VPEEEKSDVQPIKEPKEQGLKEPEKRSILTGSEIIELQEDADYEYSSPSGSQPPSPEQQAGEQEPVNVQKPSQEDQETTQE